MAQILSELSEAFASTVENTGAVVVRVEARNRLPATGIVWSSDGTVVTAHHVMEQDDHIMVGLPDGEVSEASLVGRDPTTDLAVLRSTATFSTEPTWAEPDQLRVGHLVVAVGRPGKDVQATMGMISALGDSWRSPLGGTVDRYLQTDLTMYPGFSGGPLVDASGRLLGLNTSGLMRGVSLTVPGPTLHRVVDAILAHGKVRRGYLGVSSQPIKLPEQHARGLSQETGLLLVAVEPGSPAERGGLFMGDTIVGLAGSPVRHPDDLLALLSEERPSAKVPLRIVRGGKVQELTVEIGERE